MPGLSAFPRQNFGLITLDDGSALSSSESLFFQLALRQSSTSYVIQANPQAIVGATSEALAAALIPAQARYNYEWELTKSPTSKPGEGLPLFHTLEMAGVRSGDKLYLLGDHKMPSWAPAPPIEPRRMLDLGIGESHSKPLRDLGFWFRVIQTLKSRSRRS